MDVPACGDIINARYRLDEVLGVGGSAVVYRAYDATGRRPVALKLFKPGPEGYDPVTIRRFEREVRIIANLTDPHTVTLFDSGRTGNYLYMVFELVGGVDLAVFLQQYTRLPPLDVRNILIQVLSSLHEAHTNGLLHRDIKPENVRIYSTPSAPLSVKLLDFGIARSTEKEQSITQTGELVGTPRYMSPEALMEQPLTPASDVYSVGILALEMLFGRDALHGNRWDEQFDRLLSGHVFSFPDIERVPQELRQIVDRMSAQRPEDRYQSAGAALRALRAIRFEEDDVTLVTDTGSRLAPSLPGMRTETDLDAPTTMVAHLDPAEYATTDKTLNRRSVVIASVAIFIATVVLLNVVLRPDEPAPPREPPAKTKVNLPAGMLAASAKGEVVEPEVVAEDRCGEAPQVSHRQMSTSTMGTRAVRWLTFLPENYDNSEKHPVLMVFHADYSNPVDMLQQTRLGDLADEKGWIIIAVEGDYQYPWRSPDDVEGAMVALEKTRERACVDDSRVFLLGQATGSIAVMSLSCEKWVSALATTSYLSPTDLRHCKPADPIPALHIAPLHTDHVPVNGGGGCPISPGKPVVSLEAYDRHWAERNGARGNPEHRTYGEDVCFVWSGEATFESCHIAGGYRWPQSSYKRVADMGNCDGETPTFPANKVIGEFFDSAPALKTQ